MDDTGGRPIIIVSHAPQEAEIKRQLAAMGMELSRIKMLLEPRSCNTAPAVGLAAWYLDHHRGPETIMAVLPSDHLIPGGGKFMELLNRGKGAAEKYGLVTFGIDPTYPETGYGYICKGERLDKDTYRVEQFIEKPDQERAAKYIKDRRFLWNSGIFMFKVGVLRSAYRRYLPAVSARLDRINWEGELRLEKAYEKMESISIDYGIMEKAEEVAVLPATIDWSDMGSFEAYYQVMPKDEDGNYCRGRILAGDTQNSLLLSGSRLVAVLGLEGTIIVDTDDALLVCARERAQEVKGLAEALERERAPEYLHHRTVNRPWGHFTSLAMGASYQVKRISILPGKRLSLQSHRYRSEHWVVVEGEATVTIDEKVHRLQAGETVYIPVGAKHRLENHGEKLLEVIEVQKGSYLGENDIIRYQNDYGRAPGEEEEPEQHYRRWLDYPDLDRLTRRQLEEMAGDKASICSCFGGELEFGTGGMRGLIGPGRNRMNRYVVRRVAQGLAQYLQDLKLPESGKKVAIAYDTRHLSLEFAREAALVLAGNRFKVFLFENPRPTPELSFAIRRLGCAAGIVITASHNPSNYNGCKIYGPGGGQAVSPMIDRLVEAIARVDIFKDVRTMGWEEARSGGQLELVGPEIDRAYLEAVRSLSLSSPLASVKVVYTPLHGTGAYLIPDLLRQGGYVDLTVVEEQMEADPEFATVETPNPEEPASFKLALERARSRRADLVLATDPDGDRVGCAVRNFRGEYEQLNGNQIGALLLDYLLGRLKERGELPPNGVMIKTIVTGDLGRKIADDYGVKTLETLTGFKYIGEKINRFEKTGEYRFLFGYEESYGFLAGTYARDKDAVGASLLIAEMAAYHQERGETLLQVLDRLYQKYGYFHEELVSIDLPDMKRAVDLMEAFDQIPPQVAGERVVQKRDYARGKCWELPGGEEYPSGLPRSEVVYYKLESGAWFCIRPSGTEPKIKIYFAVSAGTARQAEEKLGLIKQEVLSWCDT